MAEVHSSRETHAGSGAIPTATKRYSHVALFPPRPPEPDCALQLGPGARPGQPVGSLDPDPRHAVLSFLGCTEPRLEAPARFDGLGPGKRRLPRSSASFEIETQPGPVLELF